MRESGVPREEVFITTKFFPRQKDPVAEARRSLERLGVDYVDLYLVHWPAGGPNWAWPGMVRARDTRICPLCRRLQLRRGRLGTAARDGDRPPVMTQVQFSPYEYRKALLDACQQRRVALEAYSPLGKGRHLDSETVAQIAHCRAHARPGAAPLVHRAWHPADPQSTHRDRIAENAQLFDFTLSVEDIAEARRARPHGRDRPGARTHVVAELTWHEWASATLFGLRTSTCSTASRAGSTARST